MKRNAKRASEKDGAKAPPARKSPRKRPCTDKMGEEEDRHVWLDSDAKSIDCGVCFMPFEAEVFMCINGHAACAGCCVRLNKRCWCCAEGIGRVRCRPVENVLAEMSTLCKFSNHGCAEIIKFVQKRTHEESCRHAPYGCPVDGCSYRGMNMGLYEHVLDEHAGDVSSVAYLQATTVALHKSAPYRLLVQADMRKLFLLRNGGDIQALAGRSLYRVCLGPRPEGDVDIKYKMEVRGADGDGGALSLLGRRRASASSRAWRPTSFSSCRMRTGGLPLVSPSAFESVD